MMKKDWPDIVEEIEQLQDALMEIRRIVTTPTSKTAHKGAMDHYSSDFDKIRKIIADTLKNTS